MSNVSVIIPAFNEERAIGSVLDAIASLHLDAEIIVVDDHSSDRTSAVALEHGARVIRHPANAGYGRSIKDGVHAASTDTIIITDADGTYPVDQIPVLLSKYMEGFDMVVGARQGKIYQGGFLKMIARQFLKGIVEFVTGQWIPDVNSGLRIFSKSCIEPFFPDVCDGFSFTTTITLVYFMTHRRVAYLPISYEKRKGESKVRLLRDTLRTLQYIIECVVRYNPLKLTFFLLLIEIAAGVIASFFFGWLLLLQTFFVALIIFSVGLVTEGLRRPRR